MTDVTANHYPVEDAGPLVTADGKPLKASLAKALRRQRLTALGLVAPLFLFILLTFIIPIGDMLTRSVENGMVSDILPRSTAALKDWDSTSGELPDETAFEAMVLDLQEAKENRTNTRVGQRLNYERSGMSSLFRSSGRKAGKIEAPPYKEQLIDADKRWGQIETWQTIKQFSPRLTPGYYLAAVDAQRTPEGSIERVDPKNRIYLSLFGRTLLMSLVITLLTLMLGYPIAYLLAKVPTRIGNLLIILVLLPFWTSLLVRTTAWIALLQQGGRDQRQFPGWRSASSTTAAVWP